MIAALKKHGWWYFLGALAIATFLVWQAVFFLEARRGRVLLHVFEGSFGSFQRECQDRSVRGLRRVL